MDVNDNAGYLDTHIARAFFASRLAPIGATQIFVGASLLAMVVNDNAGCLDACIVLAFFASGLAPTGSTQIFVGASLLAMDVNDNADCLDARIARPFSRAGSLLQVPRKSLWERAYPRWTSTITRGI
jgi:hypothetical protein